MSMHEEALRTQRIMGGFEYDYPVEQDHISHDLNSVYDNGGHGGNNDGHHSSHDFHKDNHYDYNQDNNNNNRNNNEHILSNETSNRVNADVFSIDGDEDDRTIDVVDDTDLEVDGFLAHVKAERQRKRRKKACFAVLVAGVILAVVALIVAVTATVKAGNDNNNNNNSDTSNVQSSTATDEEEEDLVPRITEGAKRHWEDICSYESVQTERGRELCAVQCSKYDCCSAARDDYNPSCVEKYEMECAMRAGLCSFLYVNQEHLDHGSKNDNTAYSYHNDGEHEEPKDKNHDAQEHDIPNPPASLREDCDKIKVVHETTRATCEMTCELASCCNDPDPGKNCEEENQSICASYAEYCDILSEDVAEIRTSLVTEACANAETDEAGYDYCVAVCEEHMCCVIPTGDDGLAVGLGPSCKDDPEKGCESYQGCEILHTIAEQKENGGGN